MQPLKERVENACQSENVSLMDTVQEEKQSCGQIMKKNKQLKIAQSGNETKVFDEMKEF